MIYTLKSSLHLIQECIEYKLKTEPQNPSTLSLLCFSLNPCFTLKKEYSTMNTFDFAANPSYNSLQLITDQSKSRSRLCPSCN